MIRNVGTTDCFIRFTVGIVLVSMVFIGPQTDWGWFGLIPLASSFLGYCPLYSLIDFNTLSTEKK